MKPYKEQTYYELLEVDPSASMDEIRGAYERAIRLYDSDNVALYPVGDASKVEELKKLLLEAMEILTEPDLRVEYDHSLGLPARAEEGASSEASEPPAQPDTPEVAQVEARAAEARLQSDHRLEAEARAALEHEDGAHADEQRLPKLDPIPPEEPATEAKASPSAAEGGSEPAQLVMTDVIRRAETVHSTAPRYSISYIPKAPPPVESTLSAEGETFQSGEGGTSAERNAVKAEGAGAARPQGAEASPSAKTSEGATASQPSASESSQSPSSASPSASPDSADGARAAPTSGHQLEPELPPPGAPVPPSRVGPDAVPPMPPPPPRSTPVMPLPVPHRSAQPEGAMGASGEPARGGLAQAPVMAQDSAIAAAESALAQVSAHVAARGREPARARPIEIPADAVFNGELLRQIRENRGLTLQQVADRTRISSRHLENVEADRYDALPATVYLRGFLMSLARELGIDPLRASKGYLALVEKHAGQKSK